MSQQIKKKFLDPQLIEEVDQVIADLATEITSREAAVLDLTETVQEKFVLQDEKIEELRTDVDELRSDLSSETEAREEAIEGLQEQLDFIKYNADPEALDSLSEIVAAFQAADGEINEAITSLAASKDERIKKVEEDLAAETDARIAADSTLQSAVDAEASAREAADTALSDRLDVLELDPVTKTYVDDADAVLQTAIDDEVTARGVALDDLDTKLTGDIATAKSEAVTDAVSQANAYTDSEISEEKAAREAAIGVETAAREAADEGLQSQIDFIKSNTDPEALDSLSEIVAAFQAADESLYGAITSLAASKDEKIQEVKDDLADETKAREDADEALSDRLDVLEADPVTKTHVDGEIERLEGELAQEVTDRTAAITALGNSLTADIATAKSEAVSQANAYTDSEIGKVNDAIGSLDSNHFLPFSSFSNLPETGLTNKLYLTEDTSLLYRFLITQEAGLKYDLVVGPDPEDDFTTIEAALTSAKNGDKIFVKSGTYTLTSELNVNKELMFFGQDKETTIIEGSFSTATNSTLVRVSTDNVTFKGLTFKQLAGATNFCVVGQTSDPSRPGDQVKINNFTMVDCKVYYPKHGVEIRGANTIIKDVEFTLISGSSSTRYALMYSHSEGLSFISGCHFNHPLALTANNRVIYLRGSGTVGSDSSYTGQLYIENNTVEGFVSQFVNHDNLKGSNFEVYLLNNDTRAIPDVCSGDTNAFYVAVGSTPEVYTKVVCKGNKLENRHNAEGLGKGMFFLATTARTTTLPVFAEDNELANLDLRATEVTGANSPPALFTVGASLDYSSLNPFNYSDDLSGLVLVNAPADPSAFEDASGEFIQVSAPPVPTLTFYYKMKVVLDEAGLTHIDLDHSIVPGSITVAVSRAMVHLNEDFEISQVLVGSSDDTVSRLTWVGSLAIGGAEAVEVGDTVFITYAYKTTSLGLGDNSFN